MREVGNVLYEVGNRLQKVDKGQEESHGRVEWKHEIGTTSIVQTLLKERGTVR